MTNQAEDQTQPTRLKWTIQMNNDLLQCKRKAIEITSSNNPPRGPTGRKTGYMEIMEGLWNDMDYGHLHLTRQNLRDKAAFLEKAMGNVSGTIMANFGEAVIATENHNIVENTSNSEEEENLHISCQSEGNLHTATGTEVPGEVVLNSEAIKLAEKANTTYASLYGVPGDFSQRSLDTRTKERSANKDLANINMVASNMMDKRRDNQNAFQVLWVVNCIVYSVVTTFLLLKGRKKEPKHRNPRSKNDEGIKKDYMREANQIRREKSIAKAELERIKANTKITKRGRKDRKFLERECNMISVKHLIEYMERTKSDLWKLKRRFYRKKKTRRMPEDQLEVQARSWSDICRDERDVR